MGQVKLVVSTPLKPPESRSHPLFKFQIDAETDVDCLNHLVFNPFIFNYKFAGNFDLNPDMIVFSNLLWSSTRKFAWTPFVHLVHQ